MSLYAIREKLFDNHPVAFLIERCCSLRGTDVDPFVMDDVSIDRMVFRIHVLVVIIGPNVGFGVVDALIAVVVA